MGNDILSFSDNLVSIPKVPLVSIVIPTYNRKLLLAEAVQSCLDQTWPNIEVIIVDDGSTDGTEAFVEQQIAGSWAARVQYCKQENAGASAARNRGLEIARGEFVQFLDSDDILFKDKISLQIAQLERSDGNPEGCSCYGSIGHSAENLFAMRRIGIQCASPREYIRRMCMGVIHGMATLAPVWRRSFLISRPGWRTDISLGDDFEYSLRLLSEAQSIVFVEKDLFLLREHDGPRLSDTRQNRSRVLSAIRTHRAIVETVRKVGLWDASIQAGILRTARTLYANILDCGTSEDIRTYEEWVLELSRESRCASVFPLLITCRRVLGSRFLLTAHRFILRLKALRNIGDGARKAPFE